MGNIYLQCRETKNTTCRALSHRTWYIHMNLHFCVFLQHERYEPSGVSWLHFVWVPAVRPEDEQPVEQGFDVGYHVSAFRVDLQQPSLFLQNTHKRYSRPSSSQRTVYISANKQLLGVMNRELFIFFCVLGLFILHWSSFTLTRSKTFLNYTDVDHKRTSTSQSLLR